MANFTNYTWPACETLGAAPTSGASGTIREPGTVVRVGTTYYVQAGTLASPLWIQCEADFETVGKARAYALMGLTPDDLVGHSFVLTAQDYTNYCTAYVVGTGTNTAAYRGYTFATGGTSGGIAGYYLANTSYSADARTSPWYSRVRMKVATAITTQTMAYTGMMYATGQIAAAIGVIGSAYSGDAGTDTYFSWVRGTTVPAYTLGGKFTTAIDTNYHWFEVWSNGTNLNAALDGVSSTAGSTGMTTAIGVYTTQVWNGTDNVDRQIVEHWRADYNVTL